MGLQIDRGFDINYILSDLSKNVFNLDRESNVILGVISKHGPLNENQIKNLAYKKSHNITRDVARYRLILEKNQKNFLNLGLVTQKSGGFIGNFKKYEKMYSLTFKGFLASLNTVTFEQNYMVKKYRKFLKIMFKEIPYFDEFVILAIKYNIAMFLFEQNFNNQNLKINDVVERIRHFNDTNPYKFWDTTASIPRLSKKDEYCLNEIRRRYCLTGLIVRKIFWDEKYTSDSPIHFIKYWYEYFEDISTRFSFEDNWKKYWKKIPLLVGTVPSFEHEIIPEAKNILKDFKFSWKDEEVESPIWEP